MKTADCGESQTENTYSNGVLSKITSKAAGDIKASYSFIRDMFGKITQTKVGERVLSTSTYDAGNGLLREVKSANNQISRFNYDKLDRMTKKQNLNGKQKDHVEYIYNNKNRLVETFDSENNLTTKLEYDTFGRLAYVRRSDGVSSDIKYNTWVDGLVDKVTSKIFGITQTVANTFGMVSMLENSKITVGNASIWSKYAYDTLGRIDSTDALNSDETSGIRHKIDYTAGASQNITTNLVDSITLQKKSGANWVDIDSGKKFNYVYDDLGNITETL